MNRTWKWVIAIAVLLIVGAISVPIVLVVKFASKGRMVEAEIARIKAAGEPVCAADLAGRPIPDSENAALVYEKCFAHLPKSSESPESKALADFLDPEKRAADPKLWSEARSILPRYTQAIALAEKAAAMPKCRFPVEWAKGADATFPHLSRIRALARALAAQALVDAKGGRMNEAAHHIGLICRITDSLADEPSLVSQLVRCACIRIASSKLNQLAGFGRLEETDARDLAAAIGRTDLDTGLGRAYQGERVMGIMIFDDLRKGKLPFGAHGEERKIKQFYGSAAGGTWISNDEYYFLLEMRRYAADVSKPYRVLRARHLDSDPNVPRYALISTTILPVYSRANAARDRAIANLAGSRIFLGLLAYRDRFGSYPARLDELKTQVNWQLPEDPFSGRPFIYRRQGNGFLLYSIGYDLKDNGGIEPKPNKPADIVWRLGR